MQAICMHQKRSVIAGTVMIIGSGPTSSQATV
jgi:hypothetical protein